MRTVHSAVRHVSRSSDGASGRGKAPSSLRCVGSSDLLGALPPAPNRRAALAGARQPAAAGPHTSPHSSPRRLGLQLGARPGPHVRPFRPRKRFRSPTHRRTGKADNTTAPRERQAEFACRLSTRRFARVQFAEHSQDRVLSVAPTRYRWWIMEIELVRGTRRRKHVEAVLVGDRLRVSFPRWMSIDEAQVTARGARRTHAPAHRFVGDRRRRPRPAPGARVRAARARASVRWVDNMRQRWGSCTPEDGSIRVSSRLAAYPAWVLDYVLVHELAHLVVASHGPAHDALVDRFPLRRAGPGLPDRGRPRSRRRRRRAAAPGGRRPALTGRRRRSPAAHTISACRTPRSC